ncbi:MAG: acetyl-CoA acetyltransferase [Deltaproteobacteria bacterium]|nr:acetyl-CoA acetyltransferase [Deltaproteobacteria bacterium]
MDLTEKEPRVTDYSIKDKVAIVGIGETQYYKAGQAPVSEFQLALEAIQKAVADAGLRVEDIDGFASYSDDRNDPTRLAAALGIPQIQFSNMHWGGGGGGMAGAVGNAAAAIVAGYAKHVVAFRALAQGQFGRFGQGHAGARVRGAAAYTAPYGLMSPAQMFAMRTQRFMYEHHIGQEALCAISLASYTHAQRNPRAVMYGRPLTREAYYNSRWIVEPFHLFDCCQENDGAAAVVLTRSDRARDLSRKPIYLMAAAQGTGYRQWATAHNDPDYATSNFKTLAPRLFDMAGISPKDVDVAQIYENFTGGVLMSIVEHGFCDADEAEQFCTGGNLEWTNGKLPINTSGGNLAESYMHGLELVLEGVRQLRGDSTCQVKDAQVCLIAAGPMVSPVSNLLLRN